MLNGLKRMLCLRLNRLSLSLSPPPLFLSLSQTLLCCSDGGGRGARATERFSNFQKFLRCAAVFLRARCAINEPPLPPDLLLANVSPSWFLLAGRCLRIPRWLLFSGDSRWDVPTPSLCITSSDEQRCVAGGGWDSASPLRRSACQPTLTRRVSLISLTFLRRIITLRNDI